MTLLTDEDKNITEPQFDNEKLAELIEEAKKDPEAFAKRKYQSDTYIKTIERNQDALRQDFLKAKEEIAVRAKLEDLVTQLSNKAPSNDINPPVKEATPPPVDWDSLVSSKIQENDLKKKQEENYNLVKKTLRDKLGPNYQEHLSEQIETLGLTDEFVTDLAKKHPTVLLKTLGLDQPQKHEQFQTPPRSNSTFTPKGQQKRTWTYYQELRKKDPNAFYDPKTNIQMQKDYLNLGSEFEDGDFKRFG
jgi:hypothetical protein